MSLIDGINDGAAVVWNAVAGCTVTISGSGTGFKPLNTYNVFSSTKRELSWLHNLSMAKQLLKQPAPKSHFASSND
jgi:hypothetical protein